MAMVNMKASAEEANEQAPALGQAAGPAYPWGLRICLDDEALAKLGMQPPAIGAVVTFSARATVTGARLDQDAAGESESSIDLQITDMEIGGQRQGAMLYADGATE